MSDGLKDFKRAAGILMFAASSLAALKTLADMAQPARKASLSETLLFQIDKRLAKIAPEDDPEALEYGDLL